MSQKLKRVYHPYEQWEEMRFNMWGEHLGDRLAAVARAIEFTGNHKLYGSFMLRIVREWPISCENALTDYSINRRAWLGHAACALAIQLPEDIIREAWSRLTYEQQLLANAEAGRAISLWEVDYRKAKHLCEDLDEAMLF